MNRTTEIVEYLAKRDGADELILSPNAPPVSRRGGQLRIAINTLFDAQDVNDTLTAFRARGLATSETTIGRFGSFSFGIRDVGRFRVNYATQRGSRVMTVVMVPATIPDPPDLCDDADVANQALNMLNADRPGLISVCGPNTVSNAIFVYALLQRVNRDRNKMLCMIEPALTYLMKHENSIAIQCEISTDVGSMAEGVHGAAIFAPDILFVGDVKPQDELPELSRMIENGALAIVSSVTLNGDDIFKRHYPAAPAHTGVADFIAASFTVSPAEGDKFSVAVRDMSRGQA